MPVDWSKFQQDVERLYVRQGRKAVDTIEYINRKHGSNITLRQFKFRYGGLKKLQAKEWMAIISKIRGSAKGEEYRVYLYNRQQSPKRVERAFRLYGKKIETSNPIGIDLGINTVNEHRIEIRRTAKKLLDDTPDKELDQASKWDDLLPDSISFAAFDPRTNTEHATCNYSSLLDLSFSNLPLKVQVGEVESEQPSPNIDGGDEALSLFNFEQLYFDQLELSIPENFNIAQVFNYELPSNSKLDYPLFWKEMQDMHSCAMILIGSNEDRVKGAVSSVINQTTQPQHLVRGTDGWLYSHLIKADSKLVVLDKAAFQLEGIMSNRQSQSTVSCDGIDQTTLYQIFLIIVYFVSNNDLEEPLFSRFVFWVLDNKLVQQLNLLLRMALSYGIIFRNAFLHLIPKLKFYDKSEWTRPSLLNSYPAESLEMIQKADTRAFLGLGGTKILVEAIRANHLEAVTYLVEKGTDINGNVINGIPLTTAAEKGFTDILSYLIERGADPNYNMPNSALLAAIKHKQLAAVRILLKAGAKLDPGWNLEGVPVGQWIRRESLALQVELREQKFTDQTSRVYFLIEAAEKGGSVLKRYLIDQGLGNDQMLENALYYAIKSGSDRAVRTLLQHGINSKIQEEKFQYMIPSGEPLGDNFDPLMLTLGCKRCTMQNILYYLRRAGLNLEKETFYNYKRKYKNEGIYVLDDFIVALAKVGFDLQVVGPSALEVVLTRSHDFSSFRYGDPLSQCGYWLNLGCPINEYGLRGLSGLQAAAKSGNLTLVTEFIKRGANVNLEASENGLTALQAAAKSGKPVVVDCLLDAGADYTLPPAKCNGFTALEAAAYPESGDVKMTEMNVLDILKKLIAIGAPINRRDGNANRLLLGLISSNFKQCVTFVLQSGAYVEDMAPAWDGTVLSPLQAAAMQLNREAVQLLVSLGADVNAPAHPHKGRTALQAAMLKGDIPSEQLAIVNLLLINGADVNASPAENAGRTALQEAASAENVDPDVIRFLLCQGANINALPAESNGFTALQGAAMRGNIEIIKLLLQFGADVNAPAALDNGRTAVECAAENGKFDALKFLFNYGAMPLFPATGFERAIEFATNKGHWHIVDFLRKHVQLMHPHNQLSPLGMIEM